MQLCAPPFNKNNKAANMSAATRPMADEEPMPEGKKSKAKAASRTDIRLPIPYGACVRWPASTDEKAAKKALVQAINRVMDRGNAGGATSVLDAVFCVVTADSFMGGPSDGPGGAYARVAAARV